MAEPLSEFDIARKRAKQQASQQVSQRKQALQRRFAQLGAGPGSGARIKLEQEAEREGAGLQQRAEESIGAAERAENRRRREIQEGREFARSERLGSQDFAASQAALNRVFQSGEGEKQRGFLTSEREAGQSFAAEQADLQRGFVTSEREAGQEFAGGQAELQRAFARGERIESQDFAAAQNKLNQEFAQTQATIERAFRSGEAKKARELQAQMFQKQLAFEQLKMMNQMAQFEKTYQLEKDAQEFNKGLAQDEAAHNKKSWLRRTFGDFSLPDPDWGFTIEF